MIRTLAEFKTSIPDDTIEDDDDIVQFGGKAVATVVGELLQEQGFSVEDPESAGEQGWEFSARIVHDKAKTRLWFQVTLGDEVVLIAEDTTFTIFAKTDPSMFGNTLTRLNEQLVADDRFADVLWYTLADHDARKPGAPTPAG